VEKWISPFFKTTSKYILRMNIDKVLNLLQGLDNEEGGFLVII